MTCFHAMSLIESTSYCIFSYSILFSSLIFIYLFEFIMAEILQTIKKHFNFLDLYNKLNQEIIDKEIENKCVYCVQL